MAVFDVTPVKCRYKSGAFILYGSRYEKKNREVEPLLEHLVITIGRLVGGWEKGRISSTRRLTLHYKPGGHM